MEWLGGVDFVIMPFPIVLRAGLRIRETDKAR